MLSTDDLETLITSKKREIEKEKTLLGISPPPNIYHTEENKENDQEVNPKKIVKFKENQTENLKEYQLENYEESQTEKFKDNHNVENFKGTQAENNIERRILCLQQNDSHSKKKEDFHQELYSLEEKIPPDLEQYIRRYIGIPAMLKAGEYSPNNPILRAELNTERGDALLGLGEYERRRNTLRKIRQAQYRQYLDQQAQKKQEVKEQAERERREREERERQREERERQLLLERDRFSPERRRASVCTVSVNNAIIQTTKVDTGVQVDGLSSPLSVAVQTDDVELYRMAGSPRTSPGGGALTQAERELSPRTVPERLGWQPWRAPERRRSYGDFHKRASPQKCGQRLPAELRHSYMPSIFDADAIHMRNLQAEKEAAARRQFYQQELKNQILEQQRIREERKSREKMLEQAEMRRLEEQLRMLRVAQDRELDRQHDISAAMKDNAKDFNDKRTELQREIDLEQQKILRTSRHTTPQTRHIAPQTRHNTSNSDPPRSKLPFYYPDKAFQHIENEKKPYSFNIPDNSVFSANYDVDSYLRKNLNFREKIDLDIESIGNKSAMSRNDNKVIEKALIHEPKIIEKNYVKEKAIASNNGDNISIPVLRHSPTKQVTIDNSHNLSDAMKKVDDKWKVPAVQKNILKSLPNENGKNVSILTQLGSIRRQLQLEQLKLDKMLPKDE